ncbi:MAG TPA: hypothetical protein DF613_11050 [Lachnospiraceae bacterium]|nr:hypothetical protein [Lachnospiraceae bacterium]
MSDTGNERAEYCIVVDHVSKSFGEEQVLKSVTRSFARGKIHGIVGNNGSGKTVLMKCIVGFLHPDSGSILVEGRRVGRDMDFPDNLGIIIETPGFLPNRTGVKNLQLLADLRKKIRLAEIKESIRRVGLDPEMKKPVGKYSLGMRQRLGIAQAIMEDPQILILDEPFNGLDKAVAGNMRRLLLELKAEGKTILLASHNQADIDQLCDTVCEMDAGVMTMIREDQGERKLLPGSDGEGTGGGYDSGQGKEEGQTAGALISELDLLDNAAILLAGRGVGRRERRRAANQVFERLGLTGVRHARPPMVTEKQRELVMEARKLVLQEYEETKADSRRGGQR